MASENMERNAATSRLTRPNDKATAVYGPIATASTVLRALAVGYLVTPMVDIDRLGTVAGPASVPSSHRFELST
jgi:hypothetical protein